MQQSVSEAGNFCKTEEKKGGRVRVEQKSGREFLCRDIVSELAITLYLYIFVQSRVEFAYAPTSMPNKSESWHAKAKAE